MRTEYVSYQEAQNHESAGRWRDARDAYARAGADRSAREMGLRHREALQDDLAEQMIRAIVEKENAQG